MGRLMVWVFVKSSMSVIAPNPKSPPLEPVKSIVRVPNPKKLKHNSLFHKGLSRETKIRLNGRKDKAKNPRSFGSNMPPKSSLPFIKDPIVTEANKYMPFPMHPK